MFLILKYKSVCVCVRLGSVASDSATQNEVGLYLKKNEIGLNMKIVSNAEI